MWPQPSGPAHEVARPGGPLQAPLAARHVARDRRAAGPSERHPPAGGASPRASSAEWEPRHEVFADPEDRVDRSAGPDAANRLVRPLRELTLDELLYGLVRNVDLSSCMITALKFPLGG
jgi:hypothetical protein